ncbi:MAG TPA: hypothetical protein VGV57_11620 [Thermoleophilaceae bacterium]|nr:hypothetical protein [Thermoleophilaceae bacterium]
MRSIPEAALKGVAGGAAGAVVMTAAEKLEQRLTGRPSSYVPGRTLAHLLGLERAHEDRFARNMAMHYGTGMMVGALRGIMSAANLRGPYASLMHTQVRLATDQTLENLTGVGAPPWTWPRDELAIDVLHKAIYSLAAGAVADALIEPLATSSVRRRFPGRRLKGHA